jgi:hypothetical protein
MRKIILGMCLGITISIIIGIFIHRIGSTDTCLMVCCCSFIVLLIKIGDFSITLSKLENFAKIGDDIGFRLTNMHDRLKDIDYKLELIIKNKKNRR